MAYSFERLAQAQQLFNRRTSDFYVLPHLAGPYHLRERASKRAAAVASWHDNDEDEDYKPSTKRTPSKRKLSLLHEDDQSPRSEKRARSLSPTSTLRSRLSPDIREEDDVPSSTLSQHSEPDSWDRYWAVNPDIDTPNSRYSLRRRNKESVSASPQKKDEINIEVSASKLPGDVLAADKVLPMRECAACQELGMECSLASDPDPFSYPCTTCEVDDVFCVVSPPPKWKRSCELCKGRKKELCSYRFADYDHSQPCLSCRNHGFECVAGPARHPPYAFLSTSEPSEPSSSPKIDSSATSNPPNGSSELNISEESKPHGRVNSPKIEFPASCSPPHNNPEIDADETSKRSDQLTSSAINAPKTQTPERNPREINSWDISAPPFSNAKPSIIDGSKLQEVIEITDSDDDIPKKQGSPIYISDSIESPRHATVSNTIASQSANIHRIWTELAHPVVFLADDPCDWCNNFAYGITGLGPRNPEVWTDENGTIVELQDGHIAEGKEQSRMCVSCTWNRCKIIQCSHNTLNLLPAPFSPQDEIQKAAASTHLRRASEMLSDPENGKDGNIYRSPIYEWCSICREPASGSCQTVQPVNIHADVVDCDEETHGCGLMLCEYCLELTKRFKGDLNAVVAWGRNDSSHPVYHRADMEFILSGAEHNTLYKLYMEEG
ncbi:uncharacterized protein N7500_005823 [Penicillium coprophilum]|uniref:uncharacterized protein n=1 Tax=Penicillium coprophilum TaxID=36646 RepID=UPI00239BF4F0|nr:uncharacterized protein N7500_005823 [Penicillium coprophilum]KAJ5163993.1 hypothetical protein N7500_005823 [Penicillium coprophilum]